MLVTIRDSLVASAKVMVTRSGFDNSDTDGATTNGAVSSFSGFWISLAVCPEGSNSTVIS